MKLLQSPWLKTGKRKPKQSKIEISSKKKKKFVLTLPEESSFSADSDPKKLSRDDDLIMVINDSDSSGVGVTTRSSSHKRKIDNKSDDEETKCKQKKKDVKIKNGKAQKMPKSKIEPEAKPKIPVSPGQEVLDDFLKRKELNKWRYIVDVITDEDYEALLILIGEYKEAEANMLLKEEMKNSPVTG